MHLKLELSMLALKQEELLDKILASITPIDSSIDALWVKEVNKRKNDIETNSITLVDGDEVFQKIAKRLHS